MSYNLVDEDGHVVESVNSLGVARALARNYSRASGGTVLITDAAHRGKVIARFTSGKEEDK